MSQPGENPKGYWTWELFPQRRSHVLGADEGDGAEDEEGEEEEAAAADILVLEIEIERSGKNNSNIMKG